MERPLNDWERRVVARLAAVDGADAASVRELLPHLVVTGECGVPSARTGSAGTTVARVSVERVPVAVRRMTVDDIAAAVSVLREHDPVQDVEAWRARFTRDVAAADKHPVVAVLDGEVIGYARTLPFEPDDDSPANAAPGGYYLLGLVVAEAHRRRGVGRLLTDERLRWLARQGSVRAYYYTDRQNTASQQLHEQLGFHRVTDDFWFPALPRDHAEVLYELQLVVRPAVGLAQ